MAKQHANQGSDSLLSTQAVTPAAGRAAARKTAPDAVNKAAPAVDPVASAHQADDAQWLQQAERAWRERREREEEQAARESQGERSVDLSAVDAYMTGADGTGQSLLVAQASGTPAPKAEAGKDGGEASPLLLLLGLGLAAGAGGGGGGGAAAPAQVVNNGFVFDGYVRNAVVFRDSDGDGQWDDANGNGRWDTGDEYILATDSTGQFAELGGTGRIVATSLSRLVSVNSTGGTTAYTAEMSIIGSDGKTITGAAIDNDTGLPFNGLFIAPGVTIGSTTEGNTTTNTIYVTGLSTLTSLLLQKRGVTNPTQQQIIDAAAEVNTLIKTDYEGDVEDSKDTVDFFLSGGSSIIAALITAVAAKAENEGNDPIEAINQALDTLAELIDDKTSQNDTEYGEENDADLTDPEDLADIFGLTLAEAQGIANITGGAPGAAQLAIYHDSANGEDATYNIETKETDGPVGSITVVATDGSDDYSSLTIVPDAETEVTLAQSNIRVDGDGDGAEAALTITNATGTIRQLVVEAGGTSSGATTEIDGTDLTIGDNIQVRANGDYSWAGADLGECGDITISNVDQGIVVQAEGESAEAWLSIDNATGTISTIDVKAVSVERTLDSMDVPEEDIPPVMTGHGSASLSLSMDGEVLGNITVSGAGEDGDAYATVRAATRSQREQQEFDLNAYLSADAQVGDVLTLTVEGVDLQVTLQSTDLSMDVWNLSNIVSRFNSAADCADLDVYFSRYGEDSVLGEGLILSYNDYDNHEAATLAINDTAADLAYFETDGQEAGALSVGGNLSATAAGEDSDASLGVGEDTALTLGGGTVTAVASGEDSYASVNVANGDGTVGDITATASGEDSEAYANVGSGMMIGRIAIGKGGSESTYAMDGDIKAEASGEDSTAGVNFSGASFTGDLTAEASGWSGNAYVNVNATTITAGNVTATASSYDSDASVNLRGEDGEVGAINVTADEESASADVDIDFNGTITGAITVTAASYESDATLSVNDVYVGEDAAPGITMGGGAITVSGLDDYAEAEADLEIAGGSAASILVEANGYDAGAELNVYTPRGEDVMGMDITGNVTVSATGDFSWACAELDLHDIGGNITVTASDQYSGASAELDLDGSADGNITATANGQYSLASLDVDAQSLGGGDVKAEALGGGSCADVRVIGEDGSLGTLTATAGSSDDWAGVDLRLDGAVTGDISATASGDRSKAEIDAQALTDGNNQRREFDFSSMASTLLSGDVVTLTVGEFELEMTISMESTDVDLMLGHMWNGLRNDPDYAAVENADGYLGYSSWGALWLERWNIEGVADDVTIAITRGTEDLGSVLTYDTAGVLPEDLVLDGNNLTATASGDGAEAGVWIDDTAGSIGDVTITASGNTLGEDAVTEASVDVDGPGYAVNGTISVTASGNGAQAEADLDDVTGGTIDGISATASGAATYNVGEDYYSQALAWVEVDGSATVTGTVAATASGEDSEAGIRLQSDGCGDVITYSDAIISADASGESAYASIDLDGSAGTIASITVTASGQCAEAEVEIGAGSDYMMFSSPDSEDVNTATVSGNVTVEATGYNSTAWSVLHGSAVNGNVSITAGCEDAWAAASMEIDSFGDGTISVTASAYSAYASLEIDAGSMGCGDITITASGESSMACVEIYSEIIGDGAISVTASGAGSLASLEIDTDSLGSGTISVTANSDDSQASLDIDSGSLSGNAITVTASGYNSWASAEIHVASGSVGAISVSADEEASYASLEIFQNYGEDSGIEVTGNVTATASCADAEAYVTLGSYVYSEESYLGEDGLVAFNGSVLKAEASATGANAGIAVGAGSGTILGLDVDASGASAEAWIDFTSADADRNDYGLGEDGGQIFDVSGDITVDATGTNSFAAARLTADSMDGNIDIAADGLNSGASVDFAFNSFDSADVISISAGGESSEVDASIDLGSSYAQSVDISAGGLSSDVTLELDLGARGGNVVVSGSGDVELSFVDLTAATLDLTAQGGNLELGFGTAGDRDLLTGDGDFFAELSLLGNERLVVSGWSDGDSLDFGVSGDWDESATVYGNLFAFLNAAAEALDSDTRFFYAAATGGKSYLAYDQDGLGVTGIIEFQSYTNLDWARINGAYDSDII